MCDSCMIVLTISDTNRNRSVRCLLTCPIYYLNLPDFKSNKVLCAFQFKICVVIIYFFSLEEIVVLGTTI